MAKLKMYDVAIVVVTGITLLLLKQSDPYKDMERHFHRTAQHKYYIYYLSYTIVVLAFGYHIKGVLLTIWGKLF
jgi:hypothetical protein